MKAQKRGIAARGRILTVVVNRWEQGQYAPTIREIAADTKLSIATVHRHVTVLVAQGQLQGKGRSLRPTPHETAP